MAILFCIANISVSNWPLNEKNIRIPFLKKVKLKSEYALDDVTTHCNELKENTHSFTFLNQISPYQHAYLIFHLLHFTTNQFSSTLFAILN